MDPQVQTLDSLLLLTANSDPRAAAFFLEPLMTGISPQNTGSSIVVSAGKMW